jgi:hypothetical protein
VALLLLATAMMGAGVALVDALANQRSALLQTRAVDLAANLAETLRSAPDPVAVQPDVHLWQREVRSQLPRAQPLVLQRSTRAAPSTLPAAFDIQLQWREGRSSASSQISLPLAVAASSGSP